MRGALRGARDVRLAAIVGVGILWTCTLVPRPLAPIDAGHKRACYLAPLKACTYNGVVRATGRSSRLWPCHPTLRRLVVALGDPVIEDADLVGRQRATLGHGSGVDLALPAMVLKGRDGCGFGVERQARLHAARGMTGCARRIEHDACVRCISNRRIAGVAQTVRCGASGRACSSGRARCGARCRRTCGARRIAGGCRGRRRACRRTCPCSTGRA
ncbi:hypothetical protein Q3G72_016840 [Acer saccharum]|nr:hypothetical protein Q3G72_016840 [Acer saccharum]